MRKESERYRERTKKERKGRKPENNKEIETDRERERQRQRAGETKEIGGWIRLLRSFSVSILQLPNRNLIWASLRLQRRCRNIMGLSQSFICNYPTVLSSSKVQRPLFVILLKIGRLQESHPQWAYGEFQKLGRKLTENTGSSYLP